MMVVAYNKEESTVLSESAIISQRSMAAPNIKAIQTAPTDTVYLTSTISNPPDIVLQCRKDTEIATKSFFDHLVECYSTRENMCMLINTKKSVNAVPIIDGLK